MYVLNTECICKGVVKNGDKTPSEDHATSPEVFNSSLVQGMFGLMPLDPCSIREVQLIESNELILFRGSI